MVFSSFAGRVFGVVMGRGSRVEGRGFYQF